MTMSAVARRFRIGCMALALSALLPFRGRTEIKLSPLFSDGAVLQQRSRVPIFGSAEPGESVTICTSWDGREYDTSADGSGRFLVYVKTPEAGGPYTLSINGRTVSDVMSGEVWLCSGQSNMQFALSASNLSGTEGECLPDVRVFTVPIRSGEEVLTDLEGGSWHYGPVDSIKNQVSAVAYYFARCLNAEIGVPVGIVSSSRGATAAEEWMSSALFDSMTDEVRAAYQPGQDRFPGCWYNAMIAPLQPFRIAGAVWYQGENNAARKGTYMQLMSGLIREWRAGFKSGRFPFYIVELAPFSNDWSEFREVQQSIADEVPGCGFVSIIDVGDSTNIHPKNKFPVGKRLADMAASQVYGRHTRPAPPRFSRVRLKDHGLKVFFNDMGDSLVLSYGDEPRFFEIAGKDYAFHPAHARIDGRGVFVWSENVPEPRYVRYFFGRYYSPNLFSSDGYPVAPFRMKQRGMPDIPPASRPVFKSELMPSAYDSHWHPFGFNSADAVLSLGKGGLRIRTGKSVFGYESLTSADNSGNRVPRFSALSRKGAAVIDYYDGSTKHIDIEVHPDCIMDGCKGDTLVSDVDNTRMAEYSFKADGQETVLFKDGAKIGTFRVQPDNSYYEGFENGEYDAGVISASSWSKILVVDGMMSGKSALWRNGTTGRLVIDLKVKPHSSYTLSFNASIAENSPDKAMLAVLSTDKRQIANMTITGKETDEYEVSFSSTSEERSVKLVFHNGYYSKKPCFVCLDNIRLTETGSIPYVQFGCLTGSESDIVISSVEID